MTTVYLSPSNFEAVMSGGTAIDSRLDRFPYISDFGLLQRIHPGHALTYLRTDRDEAGKRIGRVLGWDDGKMIAIREDGAAVEIHGS